MICSPLGIVEPSHLGQMFLDQFTEVCYQARGLTADDWQLVIPADLPGSFVKIYDFFLGPPDLDPQGAEGALKFTDAGIIGKTMTLNGLTVLQAFSWRTARGGNAALTRLKFDRLDKLSIFFGFDSFAIPHTMPSGLGFTIEDGRISFGGVVCRDLRCGETVAFRIETFLAEAWGWIDDRPPTKVPTDPIRPRAVVALMDRKPGPRPVSPGYEHALKRALEMK
jgi:hypothetical protein